MKKKLPLILFALIFSTLPLFAQNLQIQNSQVSDEATSNTESQPVEVPQKVQGISLQIETNPLESHFTNSQLTKEAPRPARRTVVKKEAAKAEKTENSLNIEIQSNIPKQKMMVEGYFAPLIRFTRNGTFGVGGHVAVNLFIVPEFSIAPYLHGEYFIYPLGSNSGLLGGMEVELEAGAKITFPLYENKGWKLKLGFDLGYYMQWLTYNSSISTKTHLTHNGLMIRPTFTIDFTKLWGMPIGIALYYQVTAVIPYQDYNGFGVMITL